MSRLHAALQEQEGWMPTETPETYRKCPSSSLLTHFMDPHTSVLLQPFIPSPRAPSAQCHEGADGRCTRTPGLSSKGHVKIEMGTACARGTQEPQKEQQGSLQGCVVWHRHHVFHQCCSRKTNRN